ncbi:MAG: diaminopimelate epimerase [Elusimicrobiota bacterium]|jgi:diaminopimelate epimerase|nr:diaminopimelate epimerase [Elusimicrobiota bacterium]
MKTISFIKMDGLGNDFMIIDGRNEKIKLTSADIKKAASRRTGVGFDQLFILEKSRKADVKMIIFNSDGSPACACGNGARCVADFIFNETSKKEILIEAPANRMLEARRAKLITVNMGKPSFDWRAIPLARKTDIMNMPQIIKGLGAPLALSMGNPHAVFFVKDVNKIDISKLGSEVENNKLFAQRTNVEFAQIITPSRIRMRVWERGAGITSACGSGACAVLAAAVKKGLAKNKADILMDGGKLIIEWDKNGDVLMTGPVHKSFRGEFYLQYKLLNKGGLK